MKYFIAYVVGFFITWTCAIIVDEKRHMPHPSDCVFVAFFWPLTLPVGVLMTFLGWFDSFVRECVNGR